jgi:radical SAM-linked protein
MVWSDDRRRRAHLESRSVTWLLVHFERRGAARYLSHLDTARALQRTFARAGIQLALSEGMRPKPRFSLGLPLPVGVAGLDELLAAELAAGQPEAPAELLVRLAVAAPEGFLPLAVEVSQQRVRLEPLVADYECLVAASAIALSAAAAEFALAETSPVERVSPKGRREVDLKRFVAGVSVEPAGERCVLHFSVRHRADGAARPDEVVRELLRRAGCDDVAALVTRLNVVYDGLPVGAFGRESERT